MPLERYLLGINERVLLDVNFPGGSSLTAIAGIREASPVSRVVMLSAAADHAVVGRAIAEGASGYVGKEKPIAEIIDRLNQAVNGHVAVDAGLLQQALRTRKPSDDPLWALQFLTDREWEVLDLLSTGATTEQIAKNLVLSSETVRSHLKNLYKKLEVNSREDAVRAASRLRSLSGLPA